MTELVPLLRQMAMATLVDVIDGASTIDAVGELDENWLPTLPIQRVLSADSAVLFDLETDHQDRVVEDAQWTRSTSSTSTCLSTSPVMSTSDA